MKSFIALQKRRKTSWQQHSGTNAVKELFMSRTLKLALIVTTLAMTAGCGGNKAVKPESSHLYLPDSVLAAHQGDIEGLYNAWVLPVSKSEGGYIKHSNDKEMLVSERAVVEGFERYCAANGGTTYKVGERYGGKVRCESAAGVFLGEFQIKRYRDGNSLTVNFESPQRISRREAYQKALDDREALNGPTGWVTTNEGRIRFLRIGTLKERHVVEITPREKGRPYIEVENISRVDFHEKCCSADLTLRDGTKTEINSGNFFRRDKVNHRLGYSGGVSGMPFVIIDQLSGQPYTRLLSVYDGIKTIEFESEASWKGKRADIIKTSIDLKSKDRLEMYLAALRIEAAVLHEEAARKGLLQMLPNGKLTESLQFHLESELQSIFRNSECNGSAEKGVTGTYTLVRCKVAEHEYAIVRQGFSVINEISPLSATIVLKELKKKAL